MESPGRCRLSDDRLVPNGFQVQYSHAKLIESPTPWLSRYFRDLGLKFAHLQPPSSQCPSRLDPQVPGML